MRAWFPVRLGAAMQLAVLAAAGVCAGMGSGLYAQSPGAGPVTMLIEPPAPLLPGTLGKWKRVAEGDVGDGLDYVDAADKGVLTEDGLKRFARSDYVPQTKGAAESGTITVYQFVDVSGAISAYDYFRRPGQEHLDPRLVDQAACSRDCTGVLFRSGKNVVREDFNSHGDTLDFIAHELINHLPKALGASGVDPLLPTLLPEKRLDADSVKYALGPVGYQAMGGAVPVQAVGFDKSAEAVTARYKGAGELTLLLYPTPEIAGVHTRAVEAAMKQVGKPAGTVMLRREGPLVAVTTGEWTAAEAQAMVEGVHMHSEVSFDKPLPLVFQSEIRKTYTLLESIAIFSGLGALAAIVLGVSLGFGRAAVRVMQGKPAATEPEFLRIDLREAGHTSLRDPRA